MKSIVEQARTLGVDLREGMSPDDVRSLGLVCPGFLPPTSVLTKDVPETTESPFFYNEFGTIPTGWHWSIPDKAVVEYVSTTDLDLNPEEQDTLLHYLFVNAVKCLAFKKGDILTRGEFMRVFADMVPLNNCKGLTDERVIEVFDTFTEKMTPS